MTKLRYVVTFLVLGGLVGLVAYKFRTSREWQDFDYARLSAALFQIDYGYLLLALVFIYSTYLLRSLRWREFLLPIKNTSVMNLLTATIIGFGGLALLGRPGELIRPYLIARKEDMPVSSQMAVWLVERFYDLFMVIAILGGVSYFTLEGQSMGRLPSQAAARLRAGALGIVIVTFAGLLVVVLFRRYWAVWVPWLMARLGFLPRPFVTRIEAVLQEFGQGLSAVRTSRAFAMGMVYTILIWLSISVGYFFTLHAFGPPLSDFGFSGALLVMGFGIAGSMLQVPGIGGGTQVFIILALTELFHVRAEVATSCAIIVWLLTFVAVVPPALLFLAREGLSWRKLRLLAASE